MSHTIPARGYAATSATTPLAPFTFERRAVGEKDVQIDIVYSGICHSDMHQARNEWGGAVYPMVPGHEIIGRVVAVGDKVTKFKVGDRAGVGCMVDSCRTCASCREQLQQYCEPGATFTYNCEDPKYGGQTQGGYSDTIVVDEDFTLKIPENLDMKGAAPLLCAGITTYSPLRYWNVGAGQKVGIIGLGGLGHMGVKFAHAMGAHVVMITTSPEKGADAKQLGADEVLISKDEAAMAEHANSFDFILNTIPVGHDMNPYVALLKRDATMCIVGAIEPLKPVHGGGLIMKRKSIAGSLIGGIAETQEMLDFCGEHTIVSDVEVIAMKDVNTAYERMLKSDVKYRFVIDMATL
ncbi:MAG: NAD(P)-dependent alcohol dehydrogenase [Blastochloris viridis]|uniref:NAD(P)-dependent alcohol dehydrogenase n=1 Tax=Blastochloris viridis TaxID=1079 RepID=A0A6N4RCB3_BLAVI|nr:MAG: NAD(P)-dependent alcohol dehydrogenase [Blastochloris viridis]